MMESLESFLRDIGPVYAALLATVFTWLVTALGASMVFFFKDLNRAWQDIMLGFTGGVMLAASFWSLLAPAIEYSEQLYPGMSWMPAAVGFLGGSLFIFGLDKLAPHLHINFEESEKEGVKTTWHRTTLLILAITIHNIPEGLAVGVLFGAAANGAEGVTLTAAITLAFGIGLQNFPEGFAVAMPLRRLNISRFKSFWYGQMSAIVEPVAGVIGALAVVYIEPALPFALAFAAGAMIYVVVEEVIPETQRDKNTDVAVLGLIVGFVVMMVLDVGLG
ncbi:ZIP family metal transporter [Pontibacter akesuensis]|uniref:Zinc transporter, ZIP family n=1 Tax=Pontibacter akesuensis TaxID=388950 RepID=A0A1I7GPW4_9BACT|nr:ZIP family metal transporter [Pontibacter akesuensis]GHA55631.1 zinc transporter [Pontibacter akesuensis]SFU50503.1 zinc transporter, ZIP family [Pontibacter akesuensis]